MKRLRLYLELTRLNRPIGILLLLWPTLWGLWLAAGGWPGWRLLTIFVFGTVLMRSAGCALNDYADRDFDKHVRRTAHRPVTAGLIAPWEALAVAGVLSGCAAVLLVPLNLLTMLLAVPAVVLACSYPYFKRFFAVPQAYLGVAFGFGIPMAFAAVQGRVPAVAWLLLLANVFWTIAYDTEYAMVDRADDLKIGIRTAAITFGRQDVTIVMLCYAACLVVWAALAVGLDFTPWFWLGWGAAWCTAVYHYRLIRTRDPAQCFKAFLHNNWFGACLFAGLCMQ
jgi:4-hydroxybenzoate polyprenyltransferase